MKTQGLTSATGEREDFCLLQAIASQEQTALHVFYKRYAATVYGFVARRVIAAHIAEEVTNDTFVQVWRSAISFEGRSSAKTWLLGIAKHKLLDALRTHYRVTDNEQPEPEGGHHQLADPAPGPYEQVLSRQKGAHLLECFEALSADHRECLHLAVAEGMTLTEIAEIVGAPSNTVGTRIHHAKHKLRVCLESRLGAGEVV